MRWPPPPPSSAEQSIGDEVPKGLYIGGEWRQTAETKSNRSHGSRESENP